MEFQEETLRDTFLRYNNPIVVSKHVEEPAVPINFQIQKDSSIKSKSDVLLFEKSKEQTIEDFLNCIFPPKEWEEDGKRWIQTVSSEPGTKKDVKDLSDKLDNALRQGAAKETGICPVRMKYFDQCFEELLRQEAINCYERGFLLKTVRDDLKMQLNTLENLYGSSIAYSLRKTLLEEEKKIKMKEDIAVQKENEAALKKEIEELNFKIKTIEEQEAERRDVSEEEHQRQVELLKQENSNLKENLERIIFPKKDINKKSL